MASQITRLVKRLTFVAQGVTDLVFQREDAADSANYFTYQGIDVDQRFNYIAITNQAKEDGSYCLETDFGNLITVSLTIADTVIFLPEQASKGNTVIEDNIHSFKRLRVFLDGSGDVDVILYWKVQNP